MQLDMLHKSCFLRSNVFDNVAFPLKIIRESEFHVKQKVNFLLKECSMLSKKGFFIRHGVCQPPMLNIFHSIAFDDPEV